MNKRLFLLTIFVLSLNTVNAVKNSLQNDSLRAQLEHVLDGIKNMRTSASLNTSLNQVLSLYEKRYTIHSSQYANCMMWCAYACAEFGDNKQAQNLLKQSNELFKQCGHGTFEGRDTINEIFHLDLESKLEYNSGRDYMAVRHSNRSCNLKRDYFGEQSEPYLNALLDLSRLYAERLKYHKSNRYHNMGYDAYVERIKQEFCQASESERVLYWEKAIKYIDRTLELAHKSSRKSQMGGERSLASAAYNAMLLSKGLLLNTTIGFERYISSSHNDEAIRNLHLKKQLANKQASQQVLDSLDYVILHSLQKSGQGYELPHLSIGWKDVAANLSANDVAIEFYKTAKGDYGAILLKHNWKSPKVVKLNNFVSAKGTYIPLSTAVNKISLEHYSKEHSEELWKLSKAIWTDDIVRYFPKGNDGKIYFSADGQLLVTGIEYLPFIKPAEDGAFYSISDLFPIYRLSSTRELVMKKEEYDNIEAAIYGGLRYDMEYENLLADARSRQMTAHNDLAYHPTEKKRTLREADAIEYLGGTKTEADSIVSIINRGGNKMFHAVLYTDEKGTETSFKNLSRMRHRLIHIGTHGYFYNEGDSTFSRFNLGDHPMVRSGLLFSGADYKWFGESFPQGVDDGFLTALEISNLDFRGLDLVVLSACETGKGNIKGDGVFGLQRGFKMASANSILMSLWKVDDDATCLLMTEFYKNWINGKTKHDALEQAKQSVRLHKERGWDAPKYWAAFILLDGLN